MKVSLRTSLRGTLAALVVAGVVAVFSSVGSPLPTRALAGHHPTASAADVRPQFGQNIYVLKDQNTGRCLDDSFQYGLRSFPCNGLIFQEFVMTPVAGPGWHNYEIRSNQTNRCVDDSPDFGLRAFDCNGMDFQVWFNTQNGNPAPLTNGNTWRCLDDSFDFGLRSFPCNNMDYQYWTMIWQR